MKRVFAASRRAVVGAGFALFAGGTALAKPGKGEVKEIGAVEDLMREHGVMRRALLVYSDAAVRLRGNGANVPAEPIARTVELFRRFGEGYHEMILEELNVFPMIEKTGGPAAGLVDVLKAQHARGREITAYILQVIGKGAIGTGDAEPLARAFENFVLMYRAHAAHEDTVVFPAWKEALSEGQLREVAEKFEDIEKQQFGPDGFADAVKQMADIEQTLGLGDLSRFTAPHPTKT